MTTHVQHNKSQSSLTLELGPVVNADQLRNIEQQLHLRYEKWDTQVGDNGVLSEQPLVLAESAWNQLCEYAEHLASEITSLERYIFENEIYEPELGIPSPIWDVLDSLRDPRRHRTSDSIRNMRFDFHLTKSGWLLSEVNSDVPGGWREGTSLPKLYQPHCGDLSLPPSPLERWGEAVHSFSPEGVVALLHAPGYLEDQQVVRSFMSELSRRGSKCTLIQSPSALEWSGDSCRLRGAPVGLVIRFYQIEWLSSLSIESRWQKLLSATSTLVVNPTISVISESKRFPLFLKNISGYPALKRFMPECRDPREIDKNDWENWVLKACFSNTGDSVHICGSLPPKDRQNMIREALRQPLAWVAQRLFETLPVQSSRGLVYPCIGVFVVNGKAAGAYIRLSAGQVTDYRAVEAPLLLRRG